MRRLRRRKREADSDDGVGESLDLAAMATELGPIGCLLAPLAGIVFWLWRRSRSRR